MLNELAKKIREINEEKGFHWCPDDTPTLLCLIHSEVSEALERWRDEGLLNEELADIIIRVLDLSAILGIDIEEAIKLKIDFNKNRPFKHGRKRF